jgi:hypothetical protein
MLPISWLIRALSIIGSRLGGVAVGIWILEEFAEFFGFFATLTVLVWPKAGEKVAQLIDKAIRQPTAAATAIAAITMEAITGIPVDQTLLKTIAETGPSRQNSIAMGDAFMGILGNIFDVAGAQTDMQQRSGYLHSIGNISAFFGIDLSMQIRGLVVGSIAGLTHWQELRHLERLDAVLENAFSFGRISRLIIGEYANVTILPGLKRLLNSQVKPIDMTPANALRAHRRGDMARSTLDQILDNDGWRGDIRDEEVALGFKHVTKGEALILYSKGYLTGDQLNAQYYINEEALELQAQQIEQSYRRVSEGDMIEYHQLGWASDADVTEWVKREGFHPTYRTWKQNQILHKRRFDILKQIASAWENLYQQCVVSADDLRSALDALGWQADEIDAELALLELGKRSRTFLSIAEMSQAVSLGVMSVADMDEQLRCRGYEDVDAVIIEIVALLKELPTHCLDVLKGADVASQLAAVMVSLQGRNIFQLAAKLPDLLKCLQGLVPGGPTGPAAAVKKPALPTGSINMLPAMITAGDRTRLVWKIEGAKDNRVTIDQGIGAQPADGVVFITPTADTIYTLTATNAVGTETFLTSVLVRPARPHREMVAPRPQVALFVSPRHVHEGTQVSLRWTSQHATALYLDYGTGTTAVSLNGAYLLIADKSTVIQVLATGDGGQHSASESLTVIPSAETEAKKRKPIAAVTVSPTTPGKLGEVEIHWDYKYGTDATLTLRQGTRTHVGPVGSILYTPTEDEIVRLDVTGPGGRVTAMDAIITGPPPPPPSDQPPAPAPFGFLTVTPAHGRAGEESVVKWTSTNAQTVTLQDSAGSGPVVLEGQYVKRYTHTELIILKTTGPGGSSTSTALYIVV